MIFTFNNICVIINATNRPLTTFKEGALNTKMRTRLCVGLWVGLFAGSLMSLSINVDKAMTLAILLALGVCIEVALKNKELAHGITVGTGICLGSVVGCAMTFGALRLLAALVGTA